MIKDRHNCIKPGIYTVTELDELGFLIDVHGLNYIDSRDTWEIVEEGITYTDEFKWVKDFLPTTHDRIPDDAWYKHRGRLYTAGTKFNISNNKEEGDKMSIVNKVKELALSKDEKALRQAGFKDCDGDWTCDSWEVIEAKLTEDHKDYLIDIAKKLNAEEDKKK